MKLKLGLLLILIVAYAATGIFIVPANEKAVVRRCGRVVERQPGTVDLRGSGLHWDVPWPFLQVDRVNMNEVRTLTIGSVESDLLETGGFLQTVEAATHSQYLTGDKNILNLQFSVQYRVSEASVALFLFSGEALPARLTTMVQAAASELVARSGVDYVHPLGLAELQNLLTSRVRELADRQRMGIEVEAVTVDAVSPPLRVKADFLDVSNARNDREKYINSAKAFAEQRLQSAQAEAHQLLNAARGEREQLVEAARANADSFRALVGQLAVSPADYATARRMALERRYVETMEEILRSVSAKVMLDTGQPVDLTIFGRQD